MDRKGKRLPGRWFFTEWNSNLDPLIHICINNILLQPATAKRFKTIFRQSETFIWSFRTVSYFCVPKMQIAIGNKTTAALVKGLRRLPFTEESRVRIPYAVPYGTSWISSTCTVFSFIPFLSITYIILSILFTLKFEVPIHRISDFLATSKKLFSGVHQGAWLICW